MLGTFVLSAGYKEAYYKKAQQVRRIVENKTQEILQKFDFILSPTTPHTAFDIGDKQTDPTKRYLEDIFTVHANLTGMPAISVPLKQHSNKMPYGYQIMTNNFEEDLMFNTAKYLTEHLKQS